MILVGGSSFPLTRCVDVDTFEDEILEGDQNFTVSLINAMPANAVVFSVPSTHVVIIHDNGMSTYLTKSINDIVAVSFTDVATVTFQTLSFPLPEGVNDRLCVAISDLPSGGLEIDIEVVLNVTDGNAGV